MAALPIKRVIRELLLFKSRKEWRSNLALILTNRRDILRMSANALSLPRMIAGSVVRGPGWKADQQARRCSSSEQPMMRPINWRAASPRRKGAAFGWHRLALSQLAFAVAGPVLVARGLTPLSRIGADAMAARLARRITEGRLRHYQSVAATLDFLERVAGVIAELRLARVPPEAIAGSAPDFAPLTSAYGSS
jgi:hypothetical protein